MPYCNQCGVQNPEGAAFCRSCGASMNTQAQESTHTPPQENTSTPPVYNQSPYAPQPVYTYNSPNTLTQMPTAAKVLSIVSMACGIASCATFFVGFMFSIAALITSSISRNKTPEGIPNTKAKVGLITGIIGIVLSVIWIIIYVALIGEIIDSYDSYYDYGYGYYYDF